MAVPDDPIRTQENGNKGGYNGRESLQAIGGNLDLHYPGYLDDSILEGHIGNMAARSASPDFSRLHQNPHVQEDVKESSTDSLVHSVGCPKYKCTSKSKCQLKTPPKSPPKVLHPKPWGARDPKEIPCTCFSKKRNLSSPATSVRNSPTRELRKTVQRRPHSPRSSITKDETQDDVAEVMKTFDEFCDDAERRGVTLSPSTLDAMFSKMRRKLCNTTLNSTAKAKVQAGRMGKRRTSSVDSTKQINDVLPFNKKTLPEVPQDHRSQSNQSHQPSMTSSAVRGKLEANNVILELSGPDFPDQTTALTNIFGSMLPPADRFNYVALGGNQYFGPGEVLSAIPTATFVVDEQFLPITEVMMPPSRLGRSPTRMRRRP